MPTLSLIHIRGSNEAYMRIFLYFLLMHLDMFKEKADPDYKVNFRGRMKSQV